jgi:hypothetical protein
MLELLESEREPVPVGAPATSHTDISMLDMTLAAETIPGCPLIDTLFASAPLHLVDRRSRRLSNKAP